MKLIKRFSAVLLSLVMVLAMGITASAADDNTLVIHKYMQPDAAAELPNNGTELTSAQLSGLTPLAGVAFQIDKLELKSGATVGSTDIDDYNRTTASTGETGSDGTVTFSGLSDGLYYVEETSNNTTDSTSVAFFINLPMTDPSGTGLLTTVHAYPKNTVASGSITKQVLDSTGNPGSSTTADVGTEVTWRITAQIPGDLLNYTSSDGITATTDYYRITDVLNEALTYKSLTVTVGSAVLTVGTDYILNPGTPTPAADGTTTVTIEFTDAGIDKLIEALNASGNGLADVVVDLTTEVNTKAYDGMIDDNNYAIENSASFEWKVGDNEGEGDVDDPDDPGDPDKPLPYVTPTGLLIKKTDESGDALAGATFIISDGNTDSGADTSNYAGTAKTTGTDGYVYWTSAEIKAAFNLSDAYGQFYALETAAPTGYATIIGHQEFDELSETNPYSARTLANYSSNFELPTTGGTGTLLFTIGGLVLITLAITFYVVSKRKKANNQS